MKENRWWNCSKRILMQINQHLSTISYIHFAGPWVFGVLDRRDLHASLRHAPAAFAFVHPLQQEPGVPHRCPQHHCHHHPHPHRRHSSQHRVTYMQSHDLGYIEWYNTCLLDNIIKILMNAWILHEPNSRSMADCPSVKPMQNRLHFLKTFWSFPTFSFVWI